MTSPAQRLAELRDAIGDSHERYDFVQYAINHAHAIAARERELEEENQQLTNDLQETRNAHADIARGVKKALNIEHWPEDWKGDTFQGLVCRLVQEQLAAANAEIERLRALLGHLANTGARSIAMVGESGPDRAPTQGLAFKDLADAHAFGSALVALGKYYQEREESEATDD